MFMVYHTVAYKFRSILPGMRPLHYAAWQGMLEPVTILLESGASPKEPSNDGESPLHFSCQHGHAEVVSGLLSAAMD